MYIYIYIYIYNAVDIRKEKEVGMFMKHFSFFSLLSKQLSHLALVPLKHQENCNLSIFSETGEGQSFDSLIWKEGRLGAAVCQGCTQARDDRP